MAGYPVLSSLKISYHDKRVQGIGTSTTHGRTGHFSTSIHPYLLPQRTNKNKLPLQRVVKVCQICLQMTSDASLGRLGGWDGRCYSAIDRNQEQQRVKCVRLI